jgi:hypothetical protein
MMKECCLLLSILTEFTNSIATSSTRHPRILGIDQIVGSSTFAAFFQETHFGEYNFVASGEMDGKTRIDRGMKFRRFRF